MPDPTANRGTILVVEDEDYVRKSLGELIRDRGFDAVLEPRADRALERLERIPVDVVLTDLRMPEIDGLELTRRIRARHGDLPVIVLTGHGTIASAVQCVRAGASDYILKPADPEALEVALVRALRARALRREVEYLRGSGEVVVRPVGESPAWRRVLEMARAAAATDSTVLLLGESGTGKELLAQMIHRAGKRSDRPYVRVNCAAVPIEMWESEFFGHRRGAFTGATADRDGRFRLADGGTLFMDEIGAMPIAAQAKILRVLQEGEFDRLGDQRPSRVDVRLIAATNSDLDADVRAGRFREDLFYRLNVVRIEIPPLRDREGDVRRLAERFLTELAVRHGLSVPEVDEATWSELDAYSWPGNVRELRNVIERALILSPGGTLVLPDLPHKAAPDGLAHGGRSGLNLREALSRCEREVLVEALRRSLGVRKEAARLLGIDQRNLPYYLRKHDVDPDRPEV